MKPYQLLGLPYRLGAIPDIHKAGDCYTISRDVLKSYGINSPEPTREWYRRLRRQDFDVFSEELEKYCSVVTAAKIGVIALVKAQKGYGLATYWEEGWISFVDQEVRWSQLESLVVEQFYYPMKHNFVTH
tara:strand:- start:194 stop:583 length:390 start_codon:yes stop_codon:yes gene_type:complete